MSARVCGILAALLISIFVANLIRKQKMTFKYSLIWLGACLAVLFFSIYDQALCALSNAAGFQLPSNFVFFLLLIFFTILCLFLTVYINEQNSRSEILAQSVAILELKLKQLEKNRPSTNADNPGKK